MRALPLLLALSLLSAACRTEDKPDTGGDITQPDDCAWYQDADGDGYGDPDSEVWDSCDEPATGLVEDATDCDDADAAIHPDAEELCDELDNDCDGEVDEGTELASWYADADGDGYGDPDSAVQACTAPEGHVEGSSDCDDGDAETYPGAAERCDEADNDCEG